MELCLAPYWSELSDITLSLKMTFHGVLPGSTSLIFVSLCYYVCTFWRICCYSWFTLSCSFLPGPIWLSAPICLIVYCVKARDNDWDKLVITFKVYASLKALVFN